MKSTCLFIFASFIIISGCSSIQHSFQYDNEYFPLAVGNYWVYNSSRSGEEYKRIVVVAEDTINNMKYFRVKDSSGTSLNFVNYYHYRVSGDTLFLLNYDNKENKYFERVDAIFSLDTNETARFIINPYAGMETAPDTARILRLPITRYSIEVVKKDDETIELFYRYNGTDNDYRITYKKGVGKISSKNEWGVELILEDYEVR